MMKRSSSTPSGSTGEPEIFKPNTGVRFPGVLGYICGWSEALWEGRSPDTSAKGPWSRALGAMTPGVQLVTVSGACFTAPLDGSARICVACSSCRLAGIIIVLDLMPVVDDAASILVRTGPFVHQ